MLNYHPLLNLPSSIELPDSDDTPVDNELQNDVPNLLRAILGLVWQDRQDWFFGVDMGIYHTTGANPRIPIIPDGFLSLGVERHKSSRGRSSYVMWEEEYIAPILVLEAVSQTYGNEYDEKMEKYANLGVLYYAIYNPDHWRRDKHEPFEVYRLVDRNYLLQSGEPFWLPEIGLGIGRNFGSFVGWEREWLYWFDRSGSRISTSEELAKQAKQSQQSAQKEIDRLTAKLIELGIEPDQV